MIRNDSKIEVNKYKCIVCGAELFEEPLFELDNMPATAQNIPTKDELLDDSGMRLCLCQCKGCGLVQFDCEPVDYYRDVIRSGGYSTTMVNLRRQQYKHLIDKYMLEHKKFIEIGCGRGEFLSVLKEFSVEIYGIEHKKDLVEVAKADGLIVEEGFVGDANVQLENGPFDVFLSFNFLEHQPNPNGMLQGIYNNLTEDGMGLITVPSLEYMLKNGSYYELIRDHIAYYTFATLRFLLEKNGFEILEQDVLNRDTLSVVVKKKKKLVLDKFKSSYTDLCDDLNCYIKDLMNSGKRIAIWGASHQGFTIASTVGLTGRIEYIIDSAPFKQGKYAPASQIPIISPEEAISNPTDVIIIIAPGYTDEIANIIRNRFDRPVEIAMIQSERLQIYGDVQK